jgi:hypothetical protein
MINTEYAADDEEDEYDDNLFIAIYHSTGLLCFGHDLVL